jgi:uncharacterized protein
MVTDAEILDILAMKTIAVVGLSPNPDRPSHKVAHYLQQKGYRIVPVRPGKGKILGESIYESLHDIPFPVDIVDVFRRSEHCLEISKDAVKMKARVLWFQLGVENLEAAEFANRAGILVVTNRCIAQEVSRFLT